MTATRLLAAVLVAAPGVSALAGCAADRPATTGASAGATPRPTATAAPTAAPTDQEGPADAAHAQENAMELQITVDGRRLRAVLDDSPASRDLVAQLPQTIEMRDHGGVEKTGPLRSPLSLEGQPRGADPDVGDVGYYAPGNDLVLYYGDQSYWDGIVVLGRLQGGAASIIAEMTGPVTATVESR